MLSTLGFKRTHIMLSDFSWTTLSFVHERSLFRAQNCEQHTVVTLVTKTSLAVTKLWLDFAQTSTGEQMGNVTIFFPQSRALLLRIRKFLTITICWHTSLLNYCTSGQECPVHSAGWSGQSQGPEENSVGVNFKMLWKRTALAGNDHKVLAKLTGRSRKKTEIPPTRGAAGMRGFMITRRVPLSWQQRKRNAQY